MKIYKLDDEIGRKDTLNAEKNVLTITDLKQGVRNENRVNVYVNGKYTLSLDVAQVVELGVKVGRVIDEEELAKLKRASEFGKIYQRALEWVLTRPHSVRELRDYLRQGKRRREAQARQAEWRAEKEGRKKRAKAEYGCDFDDVIVDRLVERGYVDDRKFAEYYVENRFVKKGVSEKRLRMELMQKGVAKDVIDEVLNASGRDETTEIRKIISRKRARYTDDKLTAYLCRQGFDYELVRELVAEESSTSA